MSPKIPIVTKEPLPSALEVISAIVTLQRFAPLLGSRIASAELLLSLRYVENTLRRAADKEIRRRDELRALICEEKERQKQMLH